ncbi:MAG: iron-containing alcohol dehydrogenase [Oscillospiraceae bacterium]|jgi:alcohol dehydrogenase class IV|nr:iron-containing alcohol dehydrogenase [Oscillospiraceae bacterium]
MTAYECFCRALQKAAYAGSYLLPWEAPALLRGPGCVNELPALVKSLGLRRVLLVTDPGLMKLGLPAPLIGALEKAGVFCAVYGETCPDPTLGHILDARRLYDESKCEAVIAFGGGSPMDCAKMVCFLTAYPRLKPARAKGPQPVRLRRLPPLFAVPTTAGTGSEVTIVAMVSDPETHAKYSVISPPLRPAYNVLDSALTLSLPPDLTAQTGMDALTHAVEAYISLGRTKASDAWALEAARLVFGNLEAACADGADAVARENMLFAAYRAGAAFTRAYIGYAHGIAHALGGLYGLPHGLACAVTLPAVLEACGAPVHARLADLYGAAGLPPGPEGTAEKAEAFIRAIRALNARLGIPAAFGCIREEDIPEIARRCLKESNPLYPVPRIWRQGECEGVVRGMAEKKG